MKNYLLQNYLPQIHLPALTPALLLGLGLNLALTAPADAALLVGNTRGNNVVLFGDDGSFQGNFIAPGSGGLLDPDDLTFGPDGNLYISSGNNSSGKILRYSGSTGAFIDEFAVGGMIRPYGNAFGPDGNLYVSSFLTDEILRFDGKTGAFIDVFASAPKTDRQSGQLNGPNDLLFTPDGKLLVTTQGSVAVADPNNPGSFRGSFADGFKSQVLSYDIKTGIGSVFIDQPDPSPNSFGFVSFLGLQFGPQGDLFVSDFANDIRQYDASTGALKQTISTNYTGVVPSSSFIGNLTFDPEGNLYTVGFDIASNNGAILRYDGLTGAPLPASGNTSSIYVNTTSDLKRPIGITYARVPEPAQVLGLLAVAGLTAGGLKRRDRSTAK
jgi:sugar lactone lactonase YvrE